MKQTNKLFKHLNLLRDIGAIKLSSLWFISWSNADKRLTAILVQGIVERFERIATTRGRLTAIDEMKASRLAFTRWLCGRPLSGHVGCPILKNGLPKVIPKEVRLHIMRTKDINLIKAAMTMLQIGRYFKGGKPIDLTSITEGSNPVLPKDPEILLALRKLGLEPGIERPSEWRFQWITTAGPNGPSISSCLQDLPKFNELFRQQVEVMLPDLLSFIDKILNWEKAFKLSSLMGLDKWKNDSLRKISIKEDKEGKSRPFAIFDYWSQTVLSPLHDYLFQILRNLPQDCTFNQVKGTEIIQQFKSNKNYYSYDLKSATDRFPVIFQEKVLSLLVDHDYAKAWVEIMTREPFRLKDVVDPIKFGAGQPLGAKSSWAMFTLCHHLVVHIAAIRSNSDAHYVILGDDIVLRGRALAVEYKRIMSNLGVAISEQKSHVSKDTFEFAKIWFHKGQNLSGFPIVGLAETLRKPLEMAALFVFEAPTKGYLYSIDPRSVSHFFSPIAVWNTLPPRHATYVADKVAWYFSFLSWLVTKNDGWAKYIAQSAGLVIDSFTATNLFSQVVKEKWAKQLDKTLWDFQQFGVDIFDKVKTIPPFKPVWDPKSWPGRMSATGIEFSPAPRTIPIFAALETEGKVVYSDYYQQKLESLDLELTLEEIENLKLPPRPQLKGFEPIRAKESVRTLNLISRGLNQNLKDKGHETTANGYWLTREYSSKPPLRKV
uniref:RNA-dependent RNA polymerase n=1 Tax=Diaporthe gulyae mitovirus 2 TaxID=3077426 RepID=A0AA96HA14_9VIRU|nr:MAG: RNA-dependent RNA polymerase [Diaporthe gulyae mitovirus 2]